MKLLFTLVFLTASLPATAQLGGLPRLPALPGPFDLNRPLRQASRELAPPDLREQRRQAVDELLRRDRARYERDPAGEPVLRGELTWFAPQPAQLDAAQSAGFVLLRDRVLEGLETRVVVLRAPPGLSTAEAVQRLRAIAPDAPVDFNHVYTGSGVVGAGAAGGPQAAAPGARGGVRIGLIDSAPDLRHPALRDAHVRLRGCDQPPGAHGTAVASLLVGRDGRFRGGVPDATLYAADVQCGGGAVDALADALAWMAKERVPVVNISLVGPANRTLELVVRAMAARGHVIVAAVGNDGPAAPPLYPAAYPQVIGVTGVDPRRRVLPEALQGPQVSFAAPGEAVVASAGGTGYGAARGTSFAAPVVAALIAAMLQEPDAAQAARGIEQLVSQAIDLGAPGRDTVFGHGLVGVDPR
jgi:subtilisin family serine protease